LYGQGGNDVLAGGAGDDKLYGGLGNDTFQFGRGGGSDTLYADETDVAAIDVVAMGDNIAPADVEVHFSSYGPYTDVVLKISDTTDYLQLPNPQPTATTAAIDNSLPNGGSEPCRHPGTAAGADRASGQPVWRRRRRYDALAATIPSMTGHRRAERRRGRRYDLWRYWR
jgi:hypothetical protein